MSLCPIMSKAYNEQRPGYWKVELMEIQCEKENCEWWTETGILQGCSVRFAQKELKAINIGLQNINKTLQNHK